MSIPDSVQDSTIAQLVVEAGVLPKLVEFLSRDDDSDLQLATMDILLKAAAGKAEHVEEIVTLNAVPALIRLLGSSHTEQTLQESPRNMRDLVLQAKSMDSLLKLLEVYQTRDFESKRSYVSTLYNLCRGKPKPDFKTISPSLQVLKKLLHNTDEEVLKNACWTLSCLSDGPNKQIQAVIDELNDTGVRRLVDLLNHPSTSVKLPALKVVGNIVTGNDSQT